MAIVTSGYELEDVKYRSLSIHETDKIYGEEVQDYLNHIEILWNDWTLLRMQKISTLARYNIPDLLYSYLIGWSRYYSQESRSRERFDLTSQIEEVLSHLQEYWITIPKPTEVRYYLIRYPDLCNILPHICKIARDQFGIQTQLSLEIYSDPEIEDEYLTLYIRQQDYDQDILDKIEDIRAQYEAILSGKSGWFLLTTDFRPPK